MTLQPTPEDRFTFGLWTVGWQARDPFGDATRRAARPGRDRAPPRRAGRLRRHLPRRRPDPLRHATTIARDQHIARFSKALDETGLVVPMVTTNLFTHPVFKDGAFTSNDRDVRRFALRKMMRNLDLAAELGAQTYVFWGGREGAEVDAAKDVRAALDRYREGIDTARPHYVRRAGLRHPLRDRAQAERAARRHPAADGRARARVHRRRSSTPRWWASTPRSATSRWPGSTSRTASRRRCGRASSSTSTSTASTVRSTTRTSSSATATCSARSCWSTCWRTAAGRPAYDGPRHFDYKPLRTEDIDGVWVSAAANMRTYLLLKERAAAFRADPEVQAALAASRVAELRDADARPRRDRRRPARRPHRRSRTSTRTRAAARGYGFGVLDQLAIEHLLGAR